MRVPWTAKRSNQSILKEISPIFWPPDAKSQFTGKDPEAEKDGRQKEKGATEDKLVGNITDSMDMNLSKLWEIVNTAEPGVLQSMGLRRVGHNLANE